MGILCLFNRCVAARFWDQQAEWSQKTFGSDSERGAMGPLKHLRKEVREAILDMRRSMRSKRTVSRDHYLAAAKTEIVDCLFLTFDAARRSGMTFDEFFKLANDKLAINKQRTWIRTSDTEPVEHDRSQESGGAGAL